MYSFNKLRNALEFVHKNSKWKRFTSWRIDNQEQIELHNLATDRNFKELSKKSLTNEQSLMNEQSSTNEEPEDV